MYTYIIRVRTYKDIFVIYVDYDITVYAYTFTEKYREVSRKEVHQIKKEVYPNTSPRAQKYRPDTKYKHRNQRERRRNEHRAVKTRKRGAANLRAKLTRQADALTNIS